jgi:hypothetical protein
LLLFREAIVMENATKDSFTIVLTFRFPGGRDSNGESLWQKF